MKRIVVAQRGWVVVGEYEKTDDEVVLTGASVLRRWGTSEGLGELAAKGPQANTVLDPAGTVRVPALAVVLTFDCNAETWAPK